MPRSDCHHPATSMSNLATTAAVATTVTRATNDGKYECSVAVTPLMKPGKSYRVKLPGSVPGTSEKVAFQVPRRVKVKSHLAI